MKLALTNERNTQILTITGPIEEHEVKVLKAGVSKFLKVGKNKVVVEIAEAASFHPLVVSELSALNLIAKELMGEIAIVSLDAVTHKKVQAATKPGVIGTFDSRNAAIQAVNPKITADESEYQRKIAELHLQNKDLQDQLNIMLSRLLESFEAWRLPKSAGAAEDKIKALESQINELQLELIKSRPAGAKA